MLRSPSSLFVASGLAIASFRIESALSHRRAMSSASGLISSTPAWSALSAHAASDAVAKSHLAQLLQDAERCKAMQAEFDGILLDYSRQRATPATMEMLFGQSRDNSAQCGRLPPGPR
jgi:hypothetical protein